jgi:hypothetical protein
MSHKAQILQTGKDDIATLELFVVQYNGAVNFFSKTICSWILDRDWDPKALIGFSLLGRCVLDFIFLCQKI